MAYPKQLKRFVVLLLLNTVNGQSNSREGTLSEFLTSCPESCLLNDGQANTTQAASNWCSEMDFPEPPYKTKLPRCKNVTLKRTDYYIREDKLVLEKKGYSVPYKKYSLAADNESANVCYSLNPQLHHCNLKLLDRRLYAYDESLLALKNCKTKEIIALGDFYMLPDSKGIVGCIESLGYHLSLRPRCEYISLGPTEYELLDDNTTIRLISISRNHTIYQALYTSNTSLPKIRLCFPLSVAMTNCKTFVVYPHEYRLETDHRVYVFRLKKHLNLGEYKTINKENAVQYCQPVEKYTEAYYVFYYCHIIQFVSAFFIILAITIHLLLPSINYHAKPLICQMLSMAVWYIAGPCRYLWYPETEVGCYVAFVFFYFSALTSFFWLNVLAFDLWSIFANLQTSSMLLCANMCHKKPKFLLYCAYAYCIPLIMTILSLVLEKQPSMQDALDLHPDIIAHCWFHEPKSLYLFYSGPIFFLLCVNMVLFGLTICNLRRASKGVGMVNKQRNRQLLFVCIKIFVIMGLCWIIEFITFLADWQGAATYPSIIIMSIQGILLFIIYICKPSTIRLLQRKLKGTISSKRKKPTDTSSPKGVSQSNSTSSGMSMESIISNVNSIKDETSVKTTSE